MALYRRLSSCLLPALILPHAGLSGHRFVVDQQCLHDIGLVRSPEIQGMEMVREVGAIRIDSRELGAGLF
jgi:hypothetical protein